MNAAHDPKAVRQWYEWSLVEADPGLEGSAWAALRVLEQHGLVWDQGEQLVPHPDKMQHEYEITPYGDYLIEQLAETDLAAPPTAGPHPIADQKPDGLLT